MRNRTLDAVRFSAVFAVVLQHGLFFSAQAGVRLSLATLGLSIWAVPLLFATSGYLSTLGGRRVEFARRMRRLLVPYVAWSIVLFAYGVQGALRAGIPLASVFAGLNWLGVLFAGQAYYTLWFLAMLVYVTAVGWALPSGRTRLVAAVGAMLLYAGIAVARFGQPVQGTDTWGGFLAIAPLCIATYLAGALLPDMPRPRAVRIPLVMALVAVSADAAMYVTWGTELAQNEQFATLTVGAIAALIALWSLSKTEPGAPSTASRVLGWAAWAGTFSLGIYVIHAPVLNIVRRATHMRGSTGFIWALILTVTGTLIALAASYGLSRVRTLRALVR
jgi:surface polysaccharide O-acyltransferase-like enzyme